jgi:hypothetical protein
MTNSSTVELACSLFGGLRKQQQSVAQCGIGRFCGVAAAFDDLGLHPGEGFNFVVFHGQTLPRISDVFNRWRQPDRERRMGNGEALAGQRRLLNPLTEPSAPSNPRYAAKRTGALAADVTVGRASFGLGATALDYLEVPSPIRRRLSRNSKSKRGIHNLACGR